MVGIHYSEKRIQKDKKTMRVRAQRVGLSGERVRILGKSGACGGLWYYQEGDRTDFVVVEVHGGGFMYNSAADDDEMCRVIHEKLKVPVLACDYRLTPEYKFPIGLEDVYECAKFAVEHPIFKRKKPQVLFWGHSAGANLAAGAAYLAKERKEFPVICQILDYPYMDVYKLARERRRIRSSVSGKLMDTFAFQYTLDGDLERPLISPVRMGKKELQETAKTFLLLCGRDNLNQGGKDYGKKLRGYGVPVHFHYVKGAIHGFLENYYNYPYIPLFTKLTITRKQRQLAEETMEVIIRWIGSEIILDTPKENTIK